MQTNEALVAKTVEEISSKKTASALEVVKAVFWAFCGIRKRQDFAQDTVQITLLQVVVVGVLGGALFVGILLLIVRWILTSHGYGA